MHGLARIISTGAFREMDCMQHRSACPVIQADIPVFMQAYRKMSVIHVMLVTSMERPTMHYSVIPITVLPVI